LPKLPTMNVTAIWREVLIGWSDATIHLRVASGGCWELGGGNRFLAILFGGICVNSANKFAESTGKV